MKLTPIAIAFGAMFVTSAAFAAEDFAKVDADADGKVTMEEAKAVMPDMSADKFKAADKNGDGALDPKEYAEATSG